MRTYGADPAEWRLAAEALRIRYAALYDPMAAVSTSDVDPLPHQLRAVYEELLPRTPLRFLLADDPGAGKTVMAGLYIKELMLRGDLERCLVVAPGSLVEQWRDELAEKFGLSFRVQDRETMLGGHPLLIARMDRLARSDELLAALEGTDWDLVVVDEAHRMSARWFGTELRQTRRYALGALLGRVTRHLLLMTATPHSGNSEDFQLFLALLDPDRFEGPLRGAPLTRPVDLMRRMVKEDLLTLEGRPLFPQRHAHTVPYELSAAESDLYRSVTRYVRTEMGRAERFAGDGRRRGTVGFALTVLQRRLASSPEAILRSLERRRDRLAVSLAEVRRDGGVVVGHVETRTDLWNDDLLDDLDAAETETLEESVLNGSTAATTAAELRAEIAVLDDLVDEARRVRASGTDRKWSELRSILDDQGVATSPDGRPRKLIVFTEHKDTLNYLIDQIRTLLGDAGAAVAIHGGMTREARRAAAEGFTQDPRVRVLVATDAAGEGLNLQRAHLMVNYDLPWNPNRIEQRFGRIHRIGQTQTCHLWNLVAVGTREGQVFARLLDKLDQQRADYGGKVFDVLGEAFEGRPLRDLLVEAIRYGERPEVRARLDTVVDASVGDGIERLLAERALGVDKMGISEFEDLALQMERARARRLQPHYVRAFFVAALTRWGGRIVAREAGQYEITHVPLALRRLGYHGVGSARPVAGRYERVCFEQDAVRSGAGVLAELVAPGHPLLDAVVGLTADELGAGLQKGTILYDADDTSATPRLLVAMIESIRDGHGRVVSRRFGYTELLPSGEARAAGPAPYLDYEPLPAGLLSKTAVAARQTFGGDVEQIAVDFATAHTLSDRVEEVGRAVSGRVARTRDAVRARLIAETNHWDGEAAVLRDLEDAGRPVRIRPETAYRRARDLEERLARRMAALDLEERVVADAPEIRGVALVIPAGYASDVRDDVGDMFVERRVASRPQSRETEHVERRAVDAVMAAERELGATPVEMPHNNPGFDIRSVRADGSVVQIEVKGRIVGPGSCRLSGVSLSANR